MVNWKDSKYKKIQDIKSEKNPDGTDFFSPEELSYFDDPLIGGKLENAQSVAELVEKVKRGEKTTKKEEALFNEISLERTNQSLAYRVVNFEKYRVDVVLFSLSLWIGVSDKTEAERKARIQEIDKDILDKNVKRAANDKLIRGLRINYATAIEDEKRAEKILSQRNNLQVILAGSGRLITKDHPEGQELTSITTTYSVKDYGKNNNVLVDDESTIADTIVGAAGAATPSEILDHAKGFLNNLKNIKRSAATEASVKDTALSLYNDRKYNTKGNITGGVDEFGFCYLWVLRDIGADKLKKVIEKSGSSKKDKLKKNIEVITKYISRVEAIVGKELTSAEAYEYWYGSKVKELAEAADKNDGNGFLKNKFSEFRVIPDWEIIFEFMKEVFPLKAGTSTYELQNKDYLDKIDDENYLKPKDGKKGWENLTLGGYSFNPKSSSLTDSQKAIIKSQQENVKKIESDTDFKTLTKIWWEIFGPFMNDKWDSNDNSWATGFKITDGNISDIEASYLRELECLKFCRTMRELLLKLGISSNIDDYDEHLLKICKEALKGEIIFPDRSKIIEREKLLTGSDHPTASCGLLLAAQNNEIWSDVVEWKDYASTKLVGASITELGIYKQRREDIGGKISSLELDSVNYDMQIKDLQAEKKLLQGWKDFEEKDLEGKKKSFETLYDKGKWTWNELEQALGWLRVIKKEMNDDAAFDSEFKVKEDALNKKKGEAAVPRANIDQNWENLKIKKNGSLSETIKAILKNEDKKHLTLEVVKEYFDEYAKHLELEETEKNDLAEITKAIADPSKFKDEPQEKEIDLPEFKTISVFANATDELLNKWKGLASKYKKKSNIKTLIDRVVGDATKKGKFVEHIKNDSNATGTGDDEKLGNFFTKTEPKKVIETILTHEKLDTDDKKNKEKEDMKKWSEGSGSDKKVLNMKEYGSDKEDGEPSDDGVLKFLYEAEIEADHQTRKVSGQDGNNGNGGDKKNWEGKWFSGWFEGNWRPWVSLTGIVLVIAGLAGVIFWKQISEWWNGPSEEQGEGEVNEDEKEKEEE